MKNLIKRICSILFITIPIMLLVSCEGKMVSTTDNGESMEYAYFEGQRDALEGDIRIENKQGQWSWIKSPWDGHKSTYYSYEPPYEKDFVYGNFTKNDRR